MAETNARFIGVVEIVGQLARVVALDPLGREVQGGQNVGLAILFGGRDFPGGNPQSGRRRVEPVKFAGVVEQRGVALRPHGLDDFAHRRIDIRFRRPPDV